MEFQDQGYKIRKKKSIKINIGAFKVDYFIHAFFGWQNRNQWHKMSGKNTHIYFSTFGSKINDFEQKNLEKKDSET